MSKAYPSWKSRLSHQDQPNCQFVAKTRVISAFHEEVAPPTKGFEPANTREGKAAVLNLQHALMIYAKNIIKGT